MKLKGKAIKVIISIFILITLVDLVTTLRFGVLMKYLEANPFYQYIGITGIIGINLLLIFGVYWIYKNSKLITNRFLYLNLMVTVCIGKIIAVINNIKVGLDPPTLQQAVQVTQVMKVQAVAAFGYTMAIPYLIAIITFLLFKLDHKIEIDEVK